MSKITTNINWGRLELMQKGMMDKDGQMVSPDDSVIFHYLDDEFNEQNILVKGRKDLLLEIEKRTSFGNYHPWCYSKVIN